MNGSVRGFGVHRLVTKGELTKQQAVDLSMAAGDRSMVAAGRVVWSAEDAKVASEEYERLYPVQKTDETPTEDANEPV